MSGLVANIFSSALGLCALPLYAVSTGVNLCYVLVLL